MLDLLRPIRPGDIAILLRSPGSVGTYYIDALERVGVRCWFGNSINLLETEEVQAIRSILQVLDNPLQDIPLVSVLSSKLFGFTSDDLSSIRCAKQDCCFYEALKADSSEKSQKFVSLLQSLRAKSRTSTMLGLIKHIFTLTKVDSIFASMPDGETRIDNLLGFYKVAADFEAHGGKSLSAFLSRLDSLEKKGISIETEQAGDDTITITSIHKSKGLEYPVVILPALSRKFNNDSAYDNLLCDRDLGIGLSCVDLKNRVRYPSVSKHAISAKILTDSLSEEMRILYVAMTRARDRLIMTYTSPKLEKTLNEIAARMEYSDPELLTSDVGSIGDWILISAMRRTDAGALFAVSSRPKTLIPCKTPWHIKVISDPGAVGTTKKETVSEKNVLSDSVINKIQNTLRYEYPFTAATTTPSKLTATQIKGREKDIEAVEATNTYFHSTKSFREPTFVDKRNSGFKRGNAVHTVMQYISYSKCGSVSGVTDEIDRLIREGYIDHDQAALVDPVKIAQFFETDIGRKLNASKDILREFKFSILEDSAKYDSSVTGEEILIQGVVDCAIIEDDGITIIDFKTDNVNSDSVFTAAEQYGPQVRAYAGALEHIYDRPVKKIALYFFTPGVTVIL